ncbi:hypothetical protein CA13_09930 [Planctomycetes bacterium CA13]|uniref:Uncharacterized protein n=1 Tax=Novipirellula herctigrandis TaxID=2527986 RepID=A0A5C5YX14_9BACT|nr:hypothetical protein CA13_09930 [Planctomycetes bacterium CA13]
MQNRFAGAIDVLMVVSIAVSANLLGIALKYSEFRVSLCGVMGSGVTVKRSKLAMSM